MGRIGRKPAKAPEDTTVSRQGHGLCILGHARNFAHLLSSEGPDDQQRLLHCLIGSIERRNQEEKASYGKEETHVGKYDRADDRPKLAMMAAKVGYRYWTDDRSRLG